ncbi:MAG: ABC transporter permease subunit [Lachnospiraceae bacterium]|nr:ABC transporter permease subunit [Lachnospiraceae bacterium]
MRAIYKKEFKSYFNSMMGYVFVAFLLVAVSIYFSGYNLGMGYPLLGITLSSVTFLFLILVPVLTMRSLSEEQKNKTDQLLYTSPVSVGEIVFGKYLALVSVFAIPMVVICFYPIIMDAYGTIDFGMAYVAIFGFFLLGCAYISVGLFISSITESQIIAAVISFSVLLFSYLMSGIAGFFSDTAITSLLAFTVLLLVFCLIYYIMAKNIIASCGVFVIGEVILVVLYFVKKTWFEGAIAKVLGTFDLTAASTNMIQNGILDITDIVFYLSIIGLFLFFTVQSIQKKRWS